MSIEQHAIRFSSAFIACTLLAGSALSQAAWSDQMDRPGLIGRVFGLGEWQGQVVAGGLSLSGDGRYFGNVTLFDGAKWRAMGGGIHGSEVRDFVPFQNELVVGGTFTDAVAGGQFAYNIAAYDGVDWHPIGGAELSSVFALAVYHNELYAGGEFGIRRWNGAQWVTLGTGLDGPCYALFVAPNDRLYVGGAFTNAGGAPATKVAAWNGSTFTTVGGGLGGASNATVWDFAWYHGELWACGSFDVPGGQIHEKVGVFDGTTWRGVGSFPDSSIGTYAYAVEVLGDHLFVGGTIVGTDTVPADRVIRWDGSTWADVGGVFNGSPNTGVFALHAIGSTLYVGGEFSRLVSYLPGAGIVSNSIGAFDGASWSNVGQGFGLDSNPESAALFNGELVIAGGFGEAGTEVATGPMAFDGSTWRSLGSPGGGSVATLLADQGQLYAAGTFTSIGGVAAQGVARFDGTSWHPMGAGQGGGAALAIYHGELFVGGLGNVWRFDGATWHALQPQIFGQILELCVHNDVLYIAGSMSGGGNIVAWNGTAWSTVGGGTNGTVNALVSHGNDLLAGGDFTQAGGASANHLARWNGSGWSAFGGLTGTTVYDLVHFQGDLVASGNLFVPGSPPQKYVARWDGSIWQPLAGGFPTGAALTTLVPDDAAGVLWGAGIITSADGVPSWYLALYETSPGGVGASFCAGDGTAAACPCGNFGTSGRGCANSFNAAGAHLSASGSARLQNDTLLLRATGMPPTGSALYFQGTADVAGGHGAVFGDGLRCVSGAIVRLGIAASSGGTSQHPQAGDAPISVHGAVSAGDVRMYQCWYRNPAPYCMPSGFNLTNALSVSWMQ